MRPQYDDVNFNQNDTYIRELMPAGLVKGVCVDIIDMPHTKNNFYDPAKEYSKEFVDQIKLVWETAHTKDNGRPFNISKTFNKTLNDGSGLGAESALHKVLRNWLGVEFDGRFSAVKVYGRPALLLIEHALRKNNTMKAKIQSVLPDAGDPYLASGAYKRFVPPSPGFDDVRVSQPSTTISEGPDSGDGDDDVPF